MIIEMVKNDGIKGTVEFKSQVFYSKMITDYYGCIAGNASSERHCKFSDSALLYYTETHETAKESIDARDPIHLGLA